MPGFLFHEQQRAEQVTFRSFLSMYEAGVRLETGKHFAKHLCEFWKTGNRTCLINFFLFRSNHRQKAVIHGSLLDFRRNCKT